MQDETTPFIRKVETASLIQGIHSIISCAFCRERLGQREHDGTLSISHPYTYQILCKTIFEKGKVYIGWLTHTCSEEHAQLYIVQHGNKRLDAISNSDTLPSQAGPREKMIYAIRLADNYPQETERSGKWLIFPTAEQVDTVWTTIREATKAGKLGSHSKVIGGKSFAICVYTYDYQDRDDVIRIRQVLRSLGFTQKLPYKAGETTTRGIYRQPGQRVSLFYE